MKDADKRIKLKMRRRLEEARTSSPARVSRSCLGGSLIARTPRRLHANPPKDVGGSPDATLFDAQGRQIGTPSKGPTWKLANGSEVLGKIIAKQPSPNQGSIPWLLLKVKSHQGSGQLAAATTVRRIETKGGAEPSGGCDAAHKGEVARVGYSATYQFFGQ